MTEPMYVLRTGNRYRIREPGDILEGYTRYLTDIIAAGRYTSEEADAVIKEYDFYVKELAPECRDDAKADRPEPVKTPAGDPTLNITINEADNGWIVFVTPKYLENAGDRCFVADTVKNLERTIGFLVENIDPLLQEKMQWPAELKEADGGPA